MCCDNLVCASCSRPVAQAGCRVCRAARAQLHPFAGLPASAYVLIAVLIAVAALLSAHLVR